MLNKVTLFDVLDYVWRHPKRARTFTGKWTYPVMLQMLVQWPKDCMRVVVNEERVVAVVLFELRSGLVLHVRHILCDTREAFRQLGEFYKTNFLGWTITSDRPISKYVDTQKVIRRICYAR